MNYFAGLLGGVASNLIFWFLQTRVLDLRQRDAIIIAIACFVLFGFLGYWLTSKARAGATPQGEGGVSIGTDIKSGKGVKVDATRVAGTPGAPTQIGTKIDADGEVEVKARDIKG
jgi:hypothetical protein